MGELINITGTLSDSQIPQPIARDIEVEAAIATHATAESPHPDQLAGLKFKRLTGVTHGEQGKFAVIPHDLLSANILGAIVLIRQNPGQGLPPGYTYTPTYFYDWYFDSANFYVLNSATNSANILNKPVSIVVFHS